MTNLYIHQNILLTTIAIMEYIRHYDNRTYTTLRARMVYILLTTIARMEYDTTTYDIIIYYKNGPGAGAAPGPRAGAGGRRPREARGGANKS